MSANITSRNSFLRIRTLSTLLMGFFKLWTILPFISSKNLLRMQVCVSWSSLPTMVCRNRLEINKLSFYIIGIGEAATKSILLSVVSAVDFMHTEKLVHRNLKAENVLIFSMEDLSKIKITDFGLTRKEECTVKNLDYTNTYHASHSTQKWDLFAFRHQN